MSDLIRRQAAIDAMAELQGRAYTKAELKAIRKAWKRIKALPSAQPEQRWIPVDEKLPEPRIDVWCNSDMGQMVGYYEEHVKTWYGRDDLELMVTAWMPLPDPYREREQE